MIKLNPPLNLEQNGIGLTLNLVHSFNPVCVQFKVWENK